MANRTANPGKDPVVLQVFIFRDGRFWGTECFAQATMMVGRSPEVDLQLDDDITSRMHAKLDVTPDGVVLEDQQSANGTFVNGEPVQRCLVTSRDEISIGAFTLKIKLLSRSKPQVRFRDETRVLDRTGDPGDGVPSLGPDPGDGYEEPAPEVTQRAPSAVEDDRVSAAQPAEFEDESLPTRRHDALPSIQTEEPGVRDDLDSQPTQVQVPPGSTMTVTAEEAPPPRREPPPPAPLAARRDPLGAGTGGQPVDSMADLLEPEPLAVSAARITASLPASPFREPQPAPFSPVNLAPAESPRPALSMEAAADDLPFDLMNEDEQEDYEVQHFVEPFSLLHNLVSENFAQSRTPVEPRWVLEIIGYNQDKKVQEYVEVAPGGAYRVPGDKVPMVRSAQEGGGKLRITADMTGGVIADGRTVSIDQYRTPENLDPKARGASVYQISLRKGDYANLMAPTGCWFMRFVNPPRLPPVPKARPDPTLLKSLGGSAGLHVVGLIVLGIIAALNAEAVTEEPTDRFAQIDMKDLEIEKPEEEPEIPLDELPKPEEVKPEEVKPEKKVEDQPKPKPEKVKPTKKKAGPAGPPEPAGGAGIMAALGNLSQKKPTSNIVAQVTNLDAVRVPGGNARYKVSGLVTKLPTSNVVMSSGNGVGVKGGIELLRGGKGSGAAGIGPGALGGGSTGKRGVGGVVFKAPKRSMKVRGTLSREAIAAVVQAHLKEIQYCYERNLLLNPNLAGKVIMEWTIATSGSVSVVKTATNTMQSPAVAICISAKIKAWKFPQPKGGIVVVTYPFIFNSVGF